ncbi:hypothetical protein [Amycolatopsis sp. NPDC058986]|uniref:hypothetical protein n=1 Tax=unclassified Amycolatopsis TaxID=2618356 RepID=UPI00367041D3
MAKHTHGDLLDLREQLIEAVRPHVAEAAGVDPDLCEDRITEACAKVVTEVLEHLAAWGDQTTEVLSAIAKI